MHKDTKAELQMLREFFWFHASQIKCFFCHEPLAMLIPDVTWGHRRHHAVRIKVTNHHKEHDRSKNGHKDLAWAHTSCHKKYHAEYNRSNNREEKDQEEEGILIDDPSEEQDEVHGVGTGDSGV